MISVKKHSGIYTLECSIQLPVSLSAAWDFFSSPLNLARITPPKMQFQVTSFNFKKIYAGQIITYKENVLPFLKTSWVTEITHVHEPHYFVDEQRFGPYAMWHHEHIFEQTPDGTLMTDRVSYKLPLGAAGSLLAENLVKNEVLKIFNHRTEVLNNLDFEQEKSIPLF